MPSSALRSYHALGLAVRTRVGEGILDAATIQELHEETGYLAPTALLDMATIYREPAVPGYPRGRQILDRFPGAERIVVRSHWNIPGLHGNEGAAEDWLTIKKTALVLGVRKTMEIRPNGCSADFLAPGFSNGRAMACAYCYVPQRKGYANPIGTFVNIEDIAGAIGRHAGRLGVKAEPNQVDPHARGLRTSARTAMARSPPGSRATSGTWWPCSAGCPTPRRRSPPSPSARHGFWGGCRISR